MTVLFLVLSIATQLSLCLADYKCTVSSLQVSCTGMGVNQLSQAISATINKTHITSLDVSDGLLDVIAMPALSNFTALQSFYARNCRVSRLEDDAFSLNPLLQDLDLSGNSLHSFNPIALPADNKLKTLDLSNNLLDDLSHFNVERFPELQVLNLTNNLLECLPSDILQVLHQSNKFYLIADNNPWNCSHPDWSAILSDPLKLALCTNRTFDYAPQRQDELDFVNDAEEATVCEKPNCYKCSFNFCLLWLFCGIWIGVIVGNLPKISSLLCVKPTTYVDGTTQCDYSLVDQRMMSGIIDSRTPKLQTATTRL